MNVIKFIVLIWALSAFACTSNSGSSLVAASEEKAGNLDPLFEEPFQLLTTYQQVPRFIRESLKVMIKDSSDIANPGELWDGGCIDLGYPKKMFNWAKLWNNKLLLAYTQGGFASRIRSIEVRFRGCHIKSIEVQ